MWQHLQTTTNYKNMCYEGFSDFTNNTGYFKGKIDCHNRAIYFFNEEQAKVDILEYFGKDEFVEFFDDYILRDFDENSGLSLEGVKVIQELDCNSWEYIGEIGKKETGILELYMLAFKLAQEQSQML